MWKDKAKRALWLEANRKHIRDYNLEYSKTKKGCLVRCYGRIKFRCSTETTDNWHGSHLYKGLPYFSSKEFYTWALASKEFSKLYREWVDSGYNLLLKPSVNRIDPVKGYTLANVEWITYSENCRLGAKNA